MSDTTTPTMPAKSGPKGPMRFTNGMREAYLEKIRTGGQRGASARALGINPSTAKRAMWQNSELTPFGERVIEAEMEACDAVVNALWLSATEDRNVTAQQVWLYNRRPDEWRDMRRTEVTITDDIIDAETRRLEAELDRRARAAPGTASPPPGHPG